MGSERDRWGLMILQSLFRAKTCPLSFSLFTGAVTLWVLVLWDVVAPSGLAGLWWLQEKLIKTICKGVQGKALLWLEKSFETQRLREFIMV